jgi:hypothetical protein
MFLFMKLIEFLTQIKKNKSFFSGKVVCFVGTDYPFLFFTKLFLCLDRNDFLPAPYKLLNFETVQKEELLGNLSQTFLGQKFFYWLSNSTVKASDKKGSNVLQFLLEYKGPHFAAFYLDKTKGSRFLKNTNISIVELPEVIDFTDLLKVFNFFEFELTVSKKNFIKEMLTEKCMYFNLDQICLLVQYLSLIGVNNKESFISYLNSVITQSSPSLNLLSRYFFENNSEKFFNLWSTLRNDFPDLFWLSFWSEKIYKAYFFIKLFKSGQEARARALSFGLPYGFIKSDWKKFSLKRLSNYYNFLYTNDFKVKRGSNFCFLDLFYLSHFNSLS